MTKLRNLAFSVLLLVACVFGFIPSAVAQSDTPCTDQWASCTRSAEWCDGQWCGCMSATYGYTCSASLATASNRGGHAAIEKSLNSARQRQGGVKGPQQQ